MGRCADPELFRVELLTRVQTLGIESICSSSIGFKVVVVSHSVDGVPHLKCLMDLNDYRGISWTHSTVCINAFNRLDWIMFDEAT